MSAILRGDLGSLQSGEADVFQIIQAYVKFLDCFATRANAIGARPVKAAKDPVA
jgi:hypothetical protein